MLFSSLECTHPNSRTERHFSISFQLGPLPLTDGVASRYLHQAPPLEIEGVVLLRVESVSDLAKRFRDAAHEVLESTSSAVTAGATTVDAAKAGVVPHLEAQGHLEGQIFALVGEG